MSAEIPPVPVARALVELLATRGIDRAFCVPGESYLPLLDALLDSPIDLIVCRHESGAGFAALADAQATRRPGLFLVSRGPGATNGSIAIHSAMHDAAPLVMICGQVARSELGRHAFQEVDYRKTFGDLAKWVVQVDDPDRLLDTVARALDIATSGRPGPVVIAIPEDVFEATVAASNDGAPSIRSGFALEPETVRAVASRLLGAERPLLIAGNLVNTERGRAALARVVHGFGVPVAAEFRQQDVFPNDDRLYAAQLGFKIPRAQIDVLASADLLLAVGTDLGDVPTQGFTFPQAPVPRQWMVHVYPSEEEAARVYRPQMRCIVDPVGFLEALAGCAPPVPPTRADWVESLQRYQREIRRFDASPAPDGVSFGHVVEALDRRMNEDAVLVVDAGNFNTWTQRHFLFRGERRMSGTQAGAMGMGMPGALAWSLRFPKRQVVALIGDGCLMMTGNELATVRQYGAAPKIFVADNGSYGTIRLHQEKRFPGRVSGTRLSNPDFARWAQSFGAAAFTLDTSERVDAVVAEALAVDTAAVVHVHTSLQRLSAFYTMEMK
ncbi:MAG: acetolactate synthase [Proteobacteria bacterium]|nr:acetolactate synthase [Burkholderiales bacterium]